MENRNYADNKKILLSVKNLKKYFPVGSKGLFSKEQIYVHANENITLDIYEGETLGLVGESGCGKSTFGRTLIQLYEQTEGSALYYGQNIYEMAPNYVKQVLNNIPSKLNYYKKAEEELDALITKEKSSEGIDKIAIQEKIMLKKREIENKYLNMSRIAGGLLTYNDLGKVSRNLEELLSIYKKLSQAKKEMFKLETNKTSKRKINKPEALKDIDKKIETFISEVKQIEIEIKAKEDEIEELRNICRNNPDFEKYERLKDDGVDLSKLQKEEMRQLRRDLQFIFQDPYSSLDTRMTVGQIISEGVIAHGLFKNKNSEEYNDYIKSIMQECGLAPYFIHRYPHQFSGGQRQRIGIARALALRPKFIVCDEAVSALDVSIQSQVINLLQDLREENNLTYLFITHDLSVVKYISDRIGVMYLGDLVELSESEKIFENPLHPYTRALLEAIPRTDVESNQELTMLEGDIPSAVNPPPGCRFHTRCKYAMDICSTFQPEFKEVEVGHFVACHLMDIPEKEKTIATAETNSKIAR